jgi:Flp pilus assembly protein TadB
MLREIPGSMNLMFRVFISALTNSIIYFLAAITGITCFLMGCTVAAFLILTLLGVRLYLDIHSVREVRKIQAVFDNLASMTDNVVFNHAQ